MKKFASQALKNTGFGTPKAQEKILNEVSELLIFFEQKNRSPFDPKTPLSNLTANSLISVLLNKRHDWNSEDLKRIIRITDDFLSSLSVSHELGFINQFIPAFLMKILFKDKVRECKVKSDGMKKLISEQINEHRASLNVSNTRDFIDAFLVAEKDKTMPENVFVNTVSAFFPDGAGTSADAINWAIIYLAYHPQYQKMAQNQIDEVKKNLQI